MKLNELSARPGASKAKRRVGRGIGSGKGKTAGSGHNGQKSRSGVSLNGFEGGQMPFYRRMPKRGFTNIFRKEYEILNIGQLQKAVDNGQLDAKNTVDEAALKASNLVRGRSDGVRILAKGELTVALQIDVAGASKAAMAAIENAGGKITVRPAKIVPEESVKSQKQAAKKKNKAAKETSKETSKEAAAPDEKQSGDGEDS